MATRKAVADVLAMLSRAFAGTVDEAKADVYHAALGDLTDDELRRSAVLVIRTHTGEFIPPPAILRRAVAPAPPAVDAEAVLREVERLAHYNPHSGMRYPPVAIVIDRLGDVVGYAYAAAGGDACFADDHTTRAIARRDFAKAFREAAARPGADLPVLGRPEPTTPRLVGGSRSTPRRGPTPITQLLPSSVRDAS